MKNTYGKLIILTAVGLAYSTSFAGSDVFPDKIVTTTPYYVSTQNSSTTNIPNNYSIACPPNPTSPCNFSITYTANNGAAFYVYAYCGSQYGASAGAPASVSVQETYDGGVACKAYGFASDGTNTYNQAVVKCTVTDSNSYQTIDFKGMDCSNITSEDAPGTSNGAAELTWP